MNVSRRVLLAVLIAILIAAVIADFFVEHHAYFGIDGTPGFAAWFGFAAAVLAVVLATGWRRIVGRKERPHDD